MFGLKLRALILVLCSFDEVLLTSVINGEPYEPTWSSLDKRPLPQWFDDAKVGIFIHWGVFSVPSFWSEWFWSNWKSGQPECTAFMKKNYPPGFTYQDFARDFTAEFFDPYQWADLFAKSGARYVVLTSKHHEGFTLWPSRYSFSWNAHDVGPKRDLVGDLAQAVRNRSLTFGVYHSLYEWFNPLYEDDQKSNFTTNHFVVNKILPEMVELVQTYSPDIIWSDGDWDAPDTYWKSTDFLAWLYNESPVRDTVVVNDRWGIGIPCHHGDFYNCKDRYNPGVLVPHKWENAMTIDKKSWGYRRNANIEEFHNDSSLIAELVQTVSCGGNILMNVGPTHDGMIAPIFQERLLNIGKWLQINGEAIYSSKPWKHQNDSACGHVWYTSQGPSVYAITLQWPKQNTLQLGSVVQLFQKDSPSVTLLGNTQPLKWALKGRVVSIVFPDKATVKSQWAWTLKFEDFKKTNEVKK